MALAAVVESSAASIWAAIIAAVAAVAAITSAVISWRTYRRAQPVVAWSVEPGRDATEFQLVHTGAARAFDVRITAQGENLDGAVSEESAVRMDGRTEFVEMAPGARATLYLAVGWGTPSVGIHVRWVDEKRRPGHWTSAPPRGPAGA